MPAKQCCPHIGNHDLVCLEMPIKLIHKCVGIDIAISIGMLAFRINPWVLFPVVITLLQPAFTSRYKAFCIDVLKSSSINCLASAQIGRQTRSPNFVSSFWVYIDIYKLASAHKFGQIIPDLRNCQPRTDCYDKVGILQNEIGISLSVYPGSSIDQGMIGIDHINSIPRNQCRNLQTLNARHDAGTGAHRDARPGGQLAGGHP